MTGGYLAALSNIENAQTGEPRYPLGFSTDIDSFLGLKAAVSPTVKGFGTDGAKLGSFEKNYAAIVGDWRTGVRWGVQKIVPAEVIPYGDPDGKGDLKRTNEFALRVEIVYGWHVHTDRFAILSNTP